MILLYISIRFFNKRIWYTFMFLNQNYWKTKIIERKNWNFFVKYDFIKNGFCIHVKMASTEIIFISTLPGCYRDLYFSSTGALRIYISPWPGHYMDLYFSLTRALYVSLFKLDWGAYMYLYFSLTGALYVSIFQLDWGALCKHIYISAWLGRYVYLFFSLTEALYIQLDRWCTI